MKTKIIVLLSVLIFALGMFISCGDPMTSESTGETVSSTETATETETGSETATETETGSETGSETTSETHMHVYAFVEWVNAPTLTETGKAKMKCECNEEKEEDVPALGDATVWTKGADVADACVGGKVEYTSEKYGKVTVQVAPKHQLGELVPAKAATCVAAGNIAYKECTVCHNFFHEDETPVEGNAVEIPVNPDNHTPKDAVKENEVPATCLVVGSYDSVVRCKDCDTVISSEHIVGELGDHNFVSGACSVCQLAEKYSGANVNLYGSVAVFKSVMTFDKKGVAADTAIKYETSFYSDATLTFEWVDYAAGKMKFVSKYKNSSSESDEWGYEGYALDADADEGFLQDVYYGYVDKTTGVIVVGTSKNDEKIGSGNYVFVPSDENIEGSAIVSSGAGNNMPKAMTVTLKNGTAVSVIVYDGKVEFGVTFADIAGNALVASDLKELRYLAEGFTFIVKKSGADVVAYGVKNGEIVKLGLYYGVYEGGEGEPVLTLDGMGEAKLGEKVGSYAVKDEKVELTFVDGDGLVGEFYYVTFADGKYTAIKPMSEVSFNVGEGHDGKETVTVNTFTVFKLADHKLADTATHLFKGWKLNGELIATDYIVVEGDITLEAVWAAKITVTLEDEKIEGGTETITAGVGDDMLAALPDKSGDDTFDGYYIVVDGAEMKLQQGDNFEGSDDGITIKAKYVKFPVEADIGNGNGVEGIDVPKGAVVAEYLAEKLAGKLVVKDGYKFDGWYLDADFATELATDAVASESITKVYGKWSWAGNVKYTEQKKYPFVYVAEKNAWKSTNENQGKTSSVLEIVVTSGVANIEFDYWITSENGYDYATIYYYEDGVRKELKTKGSDIAEANAQHLSTTLTYTGETEIALRISYSKDNSGNKGLDAIYIANLKINGIAIFAQAPLNPDAVGTYTTADGTVVTLTAGGGATVGDETVAFTTISENVIGVTLAAGYREITLNKADNTCVIAVPQVSVTYNYNGHGENTVINVDKNSAQTVLAETPVADGFIFRGWYKDAALTEKVEAGSSFVASADITFYAKWDAKVSLKFDYDGQGTATVEVDDKYVGDKVSGIPDAANVKFGDKVFAGWFVKNGDGTYGAEASTDTVLEGDTTYYAKWVDPSPFYGSYLVVNVSSSVDVRNNNESYALAVDFFGKANLTSYNGFSSGTVEIKFAEGSNSVVTVTNKTSYSTNIYYGIYDAATGIIAVSKSNNSTNLNGNNTFMFLISYNSAYTASDFTAYRMTADNKKYHVFMTFTDKNKENANYSLFTGESEFYVNASFKDFDGKAVAVADIKNALNLFVYNGETLVEEFAKNSSGSFVTAIDEYKGRYADFNETLGQLFFNGAGVAKLGDEVGTYAQTETGFDVYLSNNTVYYIVELIAEGETTMYIAEQPTVKITYNYMGHGVNKEEEVAKNVQYTVTEKPTAEGFKFWGWFEDEGLTTAAKTTYTPVEDKILYAKWTAAVTLKFDYNGQGTEAVVVADKYVGDNVSGIPAVAADVKFGEKVFAGWFLKHDDGSFGEEASTSTVLEGDTTYYAKWIDAAKAYGTYKGWNLYGTKSSATESSFSKEVLVVNANGTYKYGSKSGTLTDEQAAITDGAMVLDGTYYYFNKELGLMWRKYGGGKADGVGTDTDLGVDISKVSSVAYTGRSDVGSSYVAYLVITYKDETTKTAFLYNSIIVANATLEGAEATNITGKDFTVKVNGLTVAKVVGKTVLENDGLAGTYTGDYGEIIVDGYGNVTVGGVAVDYTVVAERTIKFVAANSMKEVIVDLGNGTYAKVLDGYQGTYTLPDNSTITLDGFGGAGDGKTYVVNGANVTIFDGETSTTYGIDIANKKFLGKSVFAGYTFTGSYKDVWGDTAGFSIVFDDSPEIKGHFVTNSSVFVKFTAVLNGNTLTITVDAENCLSYDSGKTYKTDSGYSGKVIVMTLTGDTLKVVSTEIATNNYSFREGSAKCEGFSL